MIPPALALSFHAGYRCRRSGACCKSGWPIPVEGPLAELVQRALASGELRLEITGKARGLQPLDSPGDLPPEVATLTTSDAAGVCAFYERGSGLCAIHHQLGRERLPSSCAHFPRVCLIDDDATYVTLSHYCPTAAGLLFEGLVAEGGVRTAGDSATRRPLVIAAPAGLLAGVPVEGLDARGQLPPLLRPGMLADRRSYRAWERLVVEELAAGEGTAKTRLDRVVRITDRVAAWSPSNALTLEEHVHRCFEEGVESESRPHGGACDEGTLYEQVRACCPGVLAPPPAPAGLSRLLDRWIDPGWAQWSPVVGRYMAAKVFGSWAAYQGQGLKTVLTGAIAALAVLRVEAARQCAADGQPLEAELLEAALREADRIAVHLADRQQMASRVTWRT